MFLQIIISILIGICAGIITGLIPGVHINLISAIVLGLVPIISAKVSIVMIAIFILSMSITHTFLDSIPSIYLGAPDESHILTALPGHVMLLNGKGHEALLLTIIGSLFSLFLCIILSPILIGIIEFIYPIIKNYIAYILILAILYLIIKSKNPLKSFLIFSLSGSLGLIVLNLKTINNVLFPMLSGLFGFSILLTSISDNNIIPKQIFDTSNGTSKHINIDNINIFQSVSLATIFGFIASFLPGFGSSQAAIFASQAIKKATKEIFLVLSGGINTVNMSLSLLTLYVLNKARNGAVLAISEIIPELKLDKLILFLTIAIIVGSIAAILGTQISKLFSKLIEKVNYKILIYTILSFITIMTIILSGLVGLVILITSTSLGIFAQKINVAKNNCLGCLILPVILFFIL